MYKKGKWEDFLDFFVNILAQKQLERNLIE